MTTKITRIFLVTVMLLLSYSSRLDAEDDLASRQRKQVDAILAPWSRADSPGATVEVVQDAQIVLHRGYGMADLEQGSPNRPETVFSLASMSKQFTAAAIALLVEQGKLHMEDNVRNIVPELPDYGDVVTIDNLIHHTSGLRDYLTLWAISGRSLTDSMPEDEILELICRQKALNHRPGAEYLYSNTDYQLLSLIVHRISGEPLSVFANKNIFEPLGMRQTHFHDDITRLVPLVAAPYEQRPDGSFALMRTQVALVGAGKAYSTVDDLALWNANFDHNTLGKGSQALIESLLTPGRLSDGKTIAYASGLDVDTYRGLPSVRHSGGSIGISTMLLRFPQQHLSILVLGNVAQLHASAIADKIADVYLGDRLSPPPSHPAQVAPIDPVPPEGAGSASDRAAYQGTYYSAELNSTYRLYIVGEQLLVQAGTHLNGRIRAMQGDHFKLVTSDGMGRAEGHSVQDDQRHVAGFSLTYGRMKDIVFKRVR